MSSRHHPLSLIEPVHKPVKACTTVGKRFGGLEHRAIASMIVAFDRYGMLWGPFLHLSDPALDTDRCSYCKQLPGFI